LRYKILGKTHLEVSELAFGALQFAKIKEENAIALVRSAHAAGINLIDTAHAYPNSEELLGKALKGIRENVYIITKAIERDKAGFLDDLHESLRRLNTSYIDIFLFHGISKDSQFEEIRKAGIIDALIGEKRKGTVRHIGFSCHNPGAIDRFYEIDDFSVIMVPLNFITLEYVEKPILDKFKKNNIGILAMKPFGGGRLQDIRLCFKFLRQYPEIIPVAGIQTIDELNSNLIYVSESDVLKEEDKVKINRIKEELGDKFCRSCGYCMPCDIGIEITDINFINVYYKQFPEDDFWNMGLDEKVELARQCNQCGACVEKCPFELDVPGIIRSNIEFYDSLKKDKNNKI
jgi:predicted aldo/keto reductase-like oxidoreductase